jgi:hydrogenase expression/formation protein HypC
MCIGLPMKVVECLPGYAVCERLGEQRRIDMKLVGEQQPGTWVLVFLDTAREVVSAADIDALFPDLAFREPELPSHLQKTLPQ